MKVMAESYGFDISGPAKNAREAVQWLYFGYLAAIRAKRRSHVRGPYLYLSRYLYPA